MSNSLFARPLALRFTTLHTARNTAHSRLQSPCACLRPLSTAPARYAPGGNAYVESDGRGRGVRRNTPYEAPTETKSWTPGAEEAPEESSGGPRSRTELLEAKRTVAKFRVIPVSPAYFSRRSAFNDSFVHVMKLMRQYQTLPLAAPGQHRRWEWLKFDALKDGIGGERIKRRRFGQLLTMIKRLNRIHADAMPAEVDAAIRAWTRKETETVEQAFYHGLDAWGRAKAVGRRKTSAAQAWVVAGDGQVIVNGKPLHHVFHRVHDRESVLWALKVTQRADKYNVFAFAAGGGTTGQAEALALAISKALVHHEPRLKSALRTVGTLARDMRMVERKKPGRRKARKMPQWVKR